MTFRNTVRIAPAAAVTALALASAGSAATAQDCDEACLRATADAFFDALVAHDPSMLDYNANARYTENGMELDFGDALWATASAAPERYRIYVPDPETGQIGMMATMEEFGSPSIMAARLKLERGRISEVEVIVNRQGQTSISQYAELDTPEPLFAEIIPPAERMERDALVAIANSYFDAIEEDDGTIAPFSERCARVENGALTAGRSNRADPPSSTAEPGPFGDSGCADQLSRGSMDFISSIDPRRIEVVDETRGLAFGIFRFNHDGDKAQLTLSDGTVVDTPAFALSPSSTLIGELFRIEDGEIVRIEAIGEMVHYGAPTGWRGE